MRNLRLITALLVTLIPTVASAQTKVGPLAIVSGNAAFASFQSASADGCQHTFGELFVLEAYTASELANGVYVSGVRDDRCTGDYNGFAGYAKGTFEVVPLVFAHYKGTLVADSYSGGAAVAVALDLWWLANGSVTHDQGVYQDGAAIDFSFNAESTTNTAGKFTLDGSAATVTASKLVNGTNGSLLLPTP